MLVSPVKFFKYSFKEICTSRFEQADGTHKAQFIVENRGTLCPGYNIKLEYVVITIISNHISHQRCFENVKALITNYLCSNCILIKE